ncbi:TRI33-like protein [Mya arenaria]|uniref:TRI33-like protein n=1 Tax=Mya arenaria TaxID=6604 RepID=A0ABY7FYY1_MYAAR|nr:TRI33-like protein [Mya arenaria]
MASSFISSRHKVSDLIHDFSCSPCEENGLNSEANYFCVDCSKYYCSRCESKHGGLFKRHRILDRKDVKKWAAVPGTVVDDLEICEHHPGKKVELFCGDHQELCCHICVSVEHRQCSMIQHIPDIARDIYDKTEFKRLPQQITDIQSKIKKLQESRMKTQQCIRDSRVHILSEIRALQRKIDQVLDQLEQATIKKMDDMVGTFEQQIEEDIKHSTRMSKDIKSLADNIAKSKMNDSLVYVGYSRCQEMITETNAFLEDTTTKQEVGLAFVPNTEC